MKNKTNKTRENESEIDIFPHLRSFLVPLLDSVIQCLKGQAKCLKTMFINLLFHHFTA